ncbi:expressed unknown protein [Seminavis robusta]|uniref:Uncharacterized protein n=1 Tax=Seminavis robusta TaxID=568900 RepID=A0A9N8EWG4_9STRA|nr:expressed unknown protein [Seminavis robusta]|eukprot:Sro1807_g298940.1 n/a (837) ;mRNA; f:7091-9601
MARRNSAKKRRSGTVGSLLWGSNHSSSFPSEEFGMDPTEVSVGDEVSSVSSNEDASHATATSTSTASSVFSIRKSSILSVSLRDLCRTPWKVTLGLAAFLDCISTVLPGRLAVHEQRGNKASCDAELELFGQHISVTSPKVVEAIAWLDQNAVYFGFLFSVLWCIQAFRDARHTREKAMRERDRRRLLHRGDSIAILDSKDELVKSGYSDGYGPWLAFYATLIMQLLFLPVGFYVMLYQGFQLVTSGKISNLEEAIQHVDISKDSDDHDQTLQSILNSTYQVVNVSMAGQDFTQDSRLSVVLLIAKHAGSTLYRLVGAAVGAKAKRWAVKKGFKEGRKLGIDVIIRPRRVWRKARKAIRWVRWGKYLAPLIATGNKLRENVEDLLKKRRQRREAVLAQRIRKILWKEMTQEERQEKAARGIQSMYRSYMVRKARWALALIQCRTDELAAIRVQSMLRRSLQRARARIRQKRTELQELEARERRVMQGDRRLAMSPYERKRLYQLQDEMKATTNKDSIDRRLLLRPNTWFAVAWKITFVFCVLLEITDLAVNPLLAKQKDKATGKPLTLSTKLQSVMIPKPMIARKQCSCSSRELEELDSWILSLSTPRQTQCPSDPWFCQPPVSAAQAFYTAVMRFVLEHFMVIVSIVVFLDVPVYFYTGELCPDTGSLIPKGFFDRWIAPGILLQLIVNPEMETVSKNVWSVLMGSMRAGPIRVWRWVEALFYPLLVFMFGLLEFKFWIPAVATVNKGQIEKPEMELVSEESPPAVRRRATMMRRTSLISSSYSPQSNLLKRTARRASCVQPRSSAFVSFVQPRRSSMCGRISIIDEETEKLKLL